MTEQDRAVHEQFKKGLEKLINENPRAYIELQKNGEISGGSVTMKTFKRIMKLGAESGGN